MGNVSHVLPSIHPMIGLRGVTAMPHTRGFAEAAVTPEADQAVLHAAMVLARVGVDLACSPAERQTYVDLHRDRGSR